VAFEVACQAAISADPCDHYVTKPYSSLKLLRSTALIRLAMIRIMLRLTKPTACS
jgi:hypothetical protein